MSLAYFDIENCSQVSEDFGRDIIEEILQYQNVSIPQRPR
jgi:hypothetical protein